MIARSHLLRVSRVRLLVLVPHSESVAPNSGHTQQAKTDTHDDGVIQ
jgi:hypothetical protein